MLEIFSGAIVGKIYDIRGVSTDSSKILRGLLTKLGAKLLAEKQYAWDQEGVDIRDVVISAISGSAAVIGDDKVAPTTAKAKHGISFSLVQRKDIGVAELVAFSLLYLPYLDFAVNAAVGEDLRAGVSLFYQLGMHRIGYY